MTQPFLALITPLTGGHPEHPIAPGGSPPGIWGPTDPRPGWGLPGGGGGSGGGQPPGTWGGSGQPFPGYGLPGDQPGVGHPGFPTPPIVIPPEQPGQPPLVIWGGSNQPMPTPPIEIPGVGTPPPGGDRQKLVEWKTAWTPQTGWIVVGIPQMPHPAPSGAKK